MNASAKKPAKKTTKQTPPKPARGGNPNGTKMSPSEVESWGSAMLSSTYPCAFIMWQHNSTYLSTSGIGSAMESLRRKAESRSSRSCRG